MTRWPYGWTGGRLARGLCRWCGWISRWLCDALNNLRNSTKLTISSSAYSTMDCISVNIECDRAEKAKY